MPFSRVLLAALLAMMGIAANAGAGITSSPVPGERVGVTVSALRDAPALDLPSSYAVDLNVVDGASSPKAIDQPLRSLPAIDPVTRIRDRAAEPPPVEPVPSPNAMALGLATLAALALARMARRFKLA
jgi:hypothetical protein